MSQDEAAVLYGSRWQIELIFKLWKQYMKIDESVSKNPERMLCEMYIKPMAALVQHWIVISSPCWLRPDKNLVKAYKVISVHAMWLNSVSNCGDQLAAAIEKLWVILAKVCRQNRRKKQPNTWLTLLWGAPEWD